MIKIKLEKNKRDDFLVKLKVEDDLIDKYRVLKRVIFESKKIKGEYNYRMPERFLSIILKSIPKEAINIDEKSIFSYLEFSDSYDEKYYYALQASARYMKKWREEGCPVIYKVNIEKETASITKEIAFKRIDKVI
ncbi:hypothetical protein NNC19_16830 [Clostridium sp. SHJSY1]|uniref:hypothetical protein n=1 Tax=Clostridium sp. SHJSY1 TaxID=2942483 RepID=UPI002874269E|nr:hypothetical protein [Clostridium sp. SHJSY1]MDS0527357.1 hypothetical protein [Clostridium sp. SHJSY1]